MKEKFSAKKICVVAVFLALNVIMSSSFMSIPVPGGHLYMNDIIICLAAMTLDPLSAFIVGGVGSFLGDALFYPTPMFVSLVTRGVQSVVISLVVKSETGKKPNAVRAGIALFVGAIIMVGGYTFGRAFVYGTPEYAVAKFPYQILQAVAGAVIAAVIVYATSFIKTAFGKYVNKKDGENE